MWYDIKYSFKIISLIFQCQIWSKREWRKWIYKTAADWSKKSSRWKTRIENNKSAAYWNPRWTESLGIIFLFVSSLTSFISSLSKVGRINRINISNVRVVRFFIRNYQALPFTSHLTLFHPIYPCGFPKLILKKTR